jgi:sigma-B regulation protein RsbU (phosphoserine phosphatase)
VDPRHTESGFFRLESELLREKRLTEASVALHTTLDLDEVLDLILKAACEGVEAERGTVFLLSDDGTELWSRVLQGAEHREIRLPVGRGIAGSVASTGEVVRIADAYEDARFDRTWDQRSGFRTRSILCAPIRARDGRIVGVFQLLNKTRGTFEAADARFLEALSVHASLALENARLHLSALEKERQDREIRLVQDVQRAFQPERSERRAGRVEVAGLNALCEDASGDYYDVVDLSDGRLAVVLGDVSGHGLHAALVMAQARAFLRAFCATLRRVDDVMNRLNDFLARDLSAGSFMSMACVAVRPESGALEWVNAGHPPPLLRRAASGDVERLDASGRVLGVLPGADYRSEESHGLEPGDVLLLYSDGATEATSPTGEFFGEARLEALLAERGNGPPQALLDAVRDALARHRGHDRLHDDLTLVALRRGD